MREELLISQGANKENYTFEILDQDGNPRSLAGFSVTLYVYDRFSRNVVLSSALSAFQNDSTKYLWTVDSAVLPKPGFYDAELEITDPTGYSETYEKFHFVVRESRRSTIADISFDSWLV